MSSSPAGLPGLEAAKSSPVAQVGPVQPLHAIDEQVTDSGYSSTISTPNKAAHDDDHDLCNKSEQQPLSARLSALAKLGPRKVENNKLLFPGLEVDDASREAYARIQPHFERQLREYLLAHPKRGEPCYPLWIRLLMVGISEADSEVHIVVFCKPKYKEVVQRFFRADHVAELCSGSGTGGRAFKLHVEGIAPRLRHEAVEVIAETLPHSGHTFCGTPISLKHSSGRMRNATLGGVIKLVDTNGEFRLYGISAGHALEELEYEADETSEEVYDFSQIGSGSTFRCFSETSADTVAPPSDPWTFAKPEVVGISVQTPSRDLSVAVKRYDWALFDMTGYKPNEVKGERARIVSSSPKPPGQTGSRDVYFASGSGPCGPHEICKKGILSPASGRIALDSTLEMVDAYILTVGEESGIHDGDSGSWVIDCTTLKLYGHIVATGFLDEGIVVPMKDMFEDIKQQFGVASVDLPSDVDLLFSSPPVAADLVMSTFTRDKSFDVPTSPMPDSGYGSAVPSPSGPPLTFRPAVTVSARKTLGRRRMRDCVVM